MSDSATPRQWLHPDILVRRLLPVICVGVVVNLAFSWYAGKDSKPLDWSRFSVFYLVLAALLSLLPWFWHCVRLAIWGRFFGVKISEVNLLRIAVATDVGGSFTPQAVGGMPVKISMLVQQGYSPGKAATLALLGNVEDVIFFSMAIPVSLFLTNPWENALWQYFGNFLSANGVFILCLVVVLPVLVVVFRKITLKKRRDKPVASGWHQWSADFKYAVRLIYTEGRRPFLLSILALSAQWLTRFSILISVLLALGLPNNLLHFFLLQWMVFVAMVLVPTPGATGGAEAAFLLVFGKIIPTGSAGTVLAGWRFLTYYFMLLVGAGLLWALHNRAGRHAGHEAE